MCARVWACVCVRMGVHVCMGWCMFGSVCMVHLYVLGFLYVLILLKGTEQ